MSSTPRSLIEVSLVDSREEKLLAPYAMHSKDSEGRRHPESTHYFRGPFQRDRDRVLHSAAFRRLNGKTQVFTGQGDYHRTRLTHTMEVSSIARTIGRALRLNEDLIEALALLHDIGDIFAPYNHDEYAATILKPFVREQCRWVVEHHGEFQMIYYGQHVGSDPNKRDRHRSHQFFEDCAQFCEKWDQASFDPDYKTEPVEFFADMTREVFARQAYDPAVVRAGAQEPLVDTEVAKARA